MEALDLPGVFRTRSHSYVRAIQAGCSQDDDCLSVFSMSGPQGSIKGGAGECVHVCVPVCERLCECQKNLRLLFTCRQPGGRHSRTASGRRNFMTACACLNQQKRVYALAHIFTNPTLSHTAHLHAICASIIFNFKLFFIFCNYYLSRSSSPRQRCLCVARMFVRDINMSSVHAHSFSVVPVLSLHLISSITLWLSHRYSKTQASRCLQLLLSASSWHDHISVPSLSTSLITFFLFHNNSS